MAAQYTCGPEAPICVGYEENVWGNCTDALQEVVKVEEEEASEGELTPTVAKEEVTAQEEAAAMAAKITQAPTEAPTEHPAHAPTDAPSQSPTEYPTNAPSESPTEVPSESPS